MLRVVVYLDLCVCDVCVCVTDTGNETEKQVTQTTHISVMQPPTFWPGTGTYGTVYRNSFIAPLRWRSAEPCRHKRIGKHAHCDCASACEIAALHYQQCVCVS